MSTSKMIAALGVLLLVVCSCGNPDVEPSDRFLVLDWNPDERRYEVVESRIETLDDPETVAGEIAFLRGGGDIRVSASDPQTEQEYRDALSVDNDQPPQVVYEREDGVIKPWDFHSFLMFTLYHHLEKAALYFEEVGVDRETVGRLPVYYAPELSLIIPINLLTDNAAYAFTLDAFLIPPQFVLRDIPLSANRGVIVHEYSHAVFNRLVHDNARVPDYLLEPWPDAATNRIRALDEGVADIFGALALGEPNFIGPSISEEIFDVDRDLAQRRVYDASLREDVETTRPAEFNPYELGSVVASTAWALRSGVDDKELGRAVVATLRDLSGVDASFVMADFFNLLLDRLPAGARGDACDVFVDRLVAISGELACAD